MSIPVKKTLHDSSRAMAAANMRATSSLDIARPFERAAWDADEEEEDEDEEEEEEEDERVALRRRCCCRCRWSASTSTQRFVIRSFAHTSLVAMHAATASSRVKRLSRRT